MQYTKRSVRSRPGLSQEEALDSLQSHPQFRPGSKIASIRRRGKVWVADLLEPKVAGPFPPSGDDGPPEEGPSDSGPPEEESDGPPPGESDSPPEDGGGDGPPDAEGGPPKPGGEKGEGGKGGVENQILHTLQQILHALSGGPVDPGMGGPDDLGPDLGGPPAPHGPPGGPGAGGLPPGGGAGAGHSARPLKPGDAPNKPGSVPVGAPAFASYRRAGFDVVPMQPEHAEQLQVCHPGQYNGNEAYAVVDDKGQAHAAFNENTETGWGNTPAKPEYQEAIDRTKPHIYPEGQQPEPGQISASRRRANPSLPPPGVAPAQASPGAGAGAGAAPGVGATCPNCHQPEPCSCGYGQGSQGGGYGQGGSPVVGRAATFVARRTANVTVKQAALELQAEYGPHGYKVARIRRDGSVLRALMTRR